MGDSSILGYVALAFAIVATAGGQLMYRMYFLDRKAWKLIATASLFVLSTIGGYVALKALSFSTVFMTTGLNYPLVTFAARWYLKEKITTTAAIGIALITLGVIVFNF